MRPLLPMLALAALAAPQAHAALTADLNLERLRAAPDAAAVEARIDAILPPAAKLRLSAMAALFGFDPRRDLTRVVLTVPDQGAPSLRLVGLPAGRIAAALSLHGKAETLANGLTGYPLPRRPEALFVALSDHEALIGRGSLLALEANAPAPLPPVEAHLALAIHLTPPAQPRLPFMALVGTVDLRADGQGHIAIDIAAKDEAGASELDRRLQVVRELVDTGAKGNLPRMQEAEELLTAMSQHRDGAHLALALAMPADLRHRAIDRLLDRLQDHLAHSAAAP